MLTLAGPVGRVTVVGQGAILCSGQYGDLVGYDSTGVEIGRASLQLRDPADCSPPDNPDNVTYGAQATLVTDVAMARAELTPMSPLEFTVFGECCGRASATYSVSLGELAPLPIDLTCTGPFDRGSEITCTAKPPKSTQVLKTTAWTFLSTTGIRVDRVVDKALLTWSGQLAMDGDVSVQGTIDGKPAESQPRRVTVIARSWATKTPQTIHSGLSTSTLSSRPTAFEGQMGRNVEKTSTVLTETNSVVISDWGPNHQITYLTQLPITVETHPEVNFNALKDTSGFYRIQETRQRTIGGVTYCAQSYVPTLIDPIKRHEGYNLEPKSHARVFQDTAAARSRVEFEPVAGLYSGTLLSSAQTAVQAAAYAESRKMDAANPVPLTCNLRYDYKGLKN